ncbi:toll/interleukin-1 receptor domain-containing protein [Mesorhizobium sp. CA7]|uniref:toll/interleukin-1 receptor domain-containing protein n=1 Tax=Mesorhizobium sp. CA7 TaxID=588501 RepID=UPI001CCB24CE|nr:toll/interleukin-1 receptor domain-containing protein [Mesorhizobium sp. CA7]MBZ9814744.1 toll/interleukin-1 receptor domain-containing protein [Mesorhizobium sp. CA7]
MKWNYFISHASEDKIAIAQPLASYLSRAGFKVWYDEFSLKIGDSLLESIDLGLSRSDFGIAILSRNFFAKKWPRSELSGLFSLESGRKKILPVWHDITASEVMSYSPIIADRLAVSSGRGLQAVADSIVSSSFPKRKKDLPFLTDSETQSKSVYASAQVEFRNLLDSGGSAADVMAFLSVNHNLILGPYGWMESVVPGFVLPSEIDVDFVVMSPQGITGPIHLELVFLGSLDRAEIGATLTRIVKQLGQRIPARKRPYNYHGGTLLGDFPQLDALGVAIKNLTHSDNMHFDDPSCWVLTVSVYNGRRSPNDRSSKVALPSAMRGIQVDVGSYDRITDTERSFRRF